MAIYPSTRVSLIHITPEGVANIRARPGCNSPPSLKASRFAADEMPIAPELMSTSHDRPPCDPPPAGRLRRTIAFATGEKRPLAVVAALTLAGGVFAALEPLLLKRVVDELLAGRRIPVLLTALAAILGLYLVRDGSAAVANWLVWRTRLRVQHRILDETVGRLHTLSLAYHRSQTVGSLLTRLDRGIQGVVGAFSELAFSVLPALVFLGVSAVLMVRLEWRMALLVFAFVPLPALIGVRAAPAQARRERALLDRWTRIYGRFNEVLSGIITVKSFAMEHEEQRRFVHHVDEANELVARGVASDSKVTAAQTLIVGLARVAVLGYGALLVARGQATVGTLLAFLGYLTGLFGPVQGLTGIYQSVQRASVSLDTIFSILDAEEHVVDAPQARDVPRLAGHLDLENVWFGYQPDRFVLRGINLRAEAGQMVALVGPSGAGKTSLAVLLQRLYDPQEGVVRIDGIDLRDMTQHSLRQQIGVVLQDASLFNDTVRANIAYARPDASAQQVEAAARAANAHDFIAALPGGYEHEVGERGNLLSAGQRQRIAIARALLRDPAVVILDEATSALDAESEALVQEALERLLVGRTTVVIAHRLSTVVRADKILVMRGGRIVEEGTHSDLLRTGGYYADLVHLQTRGLVRTTA
jgi:ATP-binding cassette subfamily B protein